MKHALLGYDTRSWRSALVMRGVDLLQPWKRTCEFDWNGPIVVSSIAGLGDLFIHLPLISGIVNECRRRSTEIKVALRPAHVSLGQKCGWDAIPFDNSLEEFFKNPRALRLSNSLRRIKSSRTLRPAWWIDLTGNGISALTIKLAGARRLAARITRGGRSLVDHPLPHRIQENEYVNRTRVAKHLGCELDFAVAQKLGGEPLSEFDDVVVLGLTTASRWKNWPLENYLKLIDSFPETRFAAVGIRREILAAEVGELGRLLARPNVIDCFDCFAPEDLVRLVAHSSAVVSNDTSLAHMANLFRIKGAVLFGPVSPHTFAAPDGLKVFHDSSCPFHPCVQWNCKNQSAWCMRKITAREVGEYLETLPVFARREVLA